MLEGKRFLALIGIPIRNSDLAKMLFADWLPVPLTVATSIERSLTICFFSVCGWGRVRVSGGFMERLFARFLRRKADPGPPGSASRFVEPSVRRPRAPLATSSPAQNVVGN